MKKDNWKRAYKLFGFSFLEFEIRVNQFSINSTSGNFTHFLQKCRRGTGKTAKLENPG